MTAVHQIIPVLASHDAVGGHTLRVRDALRAHGFESQVFAEVLVGDLARDSYELAAFDDLGRGADLLLYQASTGATAGDWLLSRSEPVAVNHHNVTPAHFFEAWAPDAAANMRRARNQLRALAPRSVAALADSAFNAEELHAMGYRNVSVNPLLLDVDGPPPAADARLMRFLRDTRHGTHWLFVGRLAPNKCQHDVITAFAVYRTLHDPGARLTLVGSPAAISYAEALLALADDVGVADAVTCVSSLSDAELAAYYEDADVFVCLSEHEGFCIPVIEAMRHDTPVVAYAAAAVPDTVGAAAVLLDDKDPLLVATAVRSLLTDEPWRARLAAAGQARVLDHAPARTVPCFVEGVERALAAARAGTGG